MRQKLMDCMSKKIVDPKLNLFNDPDAGKVITALSMLVTPR